MYGLTDLEIVNMFPDWEDNIIEKIRDHSETEQPPFMEECKNIIKESNIEKLINRLYQEINDNISVNDEGILLDFPYFRELKGGNPTITYDPFRRDINYFDHNYVFGELERFVAYHLHKTLDIGDKLQFRNYDPMVKPIVEKLIKDIYIEAINQSFVKSTQVGEKKYNLNESVDWNKIGKVLRDPANSEQIYNLLIDMFPHAKEVIDYNYYGDNEEPNPNDTFAEMKGFLWDIDKNIIKGPTLELASQFKIENEYKQDLEQHYNDYVEGKLDKFFRESPNDPRDITPEQYENMPPIMVMNGKVMDGNHRAFLAQKAGAQLPTFEIMVKPNNHPNAQKILSIIHPNDNDEDGIPNRLDISQQPNINESVDWTDKGDKKYHKNGMVNKIVGDFLKMTEISNDSITFHMGQHIQDTYRQNYNNPYITYHYNENGLTPQSKNLLYESLSNGVLWFMEQTGSIEYQSLHTNRSQADTELVKMIVDTLFPIIVQEITDYNEDEDWTMDNLYDTKFLAESIDKQEQYLRYAIKHLMDNTKWADASYSQLLLNDVISITSYINYGDFMFNFIPDAVREILDGFGLTEEEKKEIWYFYGSWVLEKVIREGRVDWPNKETHKKRYPYLTESKNNTTKFVEKIAKEIIDSSTLSGKLLYFYPPVVEEAKDEGPISADVNSDWIHNDRSTGIYHLTTDIRRIGRLYIKKIMGPGIHREDPIIFFI